jgi:hypothetical protein
MDIKKYIPGWLNDRWPLILFLSFILLAFVCSRYWVPLGQNFTLIDGELIVRAAYFTTRFYFGLCFVIIGTLFLGAGFVVKPLLLAFCPRLSERIFGEKYGRGRSYLARLFGVILSSGAFFLLNVVGSHAVPSLIRNEKVIEAGEYDGFAESVSRLTFDRCCVAQATCCPDGVSMLLRHVDGCLCSLGEARQFISAYGFPLDVSVLFSVITQGVIDPHLQGVLMAQDMMFVQKWWAKISRN